MAETQRFKRVVLVVLDGVGAGELPDAPQYGDSGADTLGNLARAFAEQTGRTLKLPNLQRWGIGNLSPMEGVPPCAPGQGFGAYGRAIEQSRGQDFIAVSGIFIAQIAYMIGHAKNFLNQNEPAPARPFCCNMIDGNISAI